MVRGSRKTTGFVEMWRATSIAKIRCRVRYKEVKKQCVASDAAEAVANTCQSYNIGPRCRQRASIALPFPTNSLSPVEIDWAAEAVDKCVLLL